jgi:hypothetical protein
MIKNPFPGPSAPIFEAVRGQMLNDLGYGATIEAWFSNNDQVLTDNSNASGNLLTQAQNDVALAESTSIATKWLEFAADIV